MLHQVSRLSLIWFMHLKLISFTLLFNCSLEKKNNENDYILPTACS